MIREKRRLFGLDFDNFTISEAVDHIICDLAAKGERAMVVTPNVDHLVQLHWNEAFREAYSKARVILADGAPIVLASRLLGSALRERVAGSDIFPLLCGRARDAGLRVMLVGGGEGVARTAAERLVERFPGLEIDAIGPSFGFDANPEDCAAIVARINAFRPHLLFVGIGAPRQEFWIAKFQESYHPCVSLGVGASIDFEAGRVKRAHPLLRRLSLEWAYRLFKEPRRLFRRYLIDDPYFFKLLLDELRQRQPSAPLAATDLRAGE